MALPGAALSGASKLATGAVARSAARAPGTVATAIKDVGHAATSHAPAQFGLDMLAHGAGVPHGVVTGIKILPKVAKAGALAADEGLAALGRQAGIVPGSPVPWKPRIVGEYEPPSYATHDVPAVDAEVIPQGQLEAPNWLRLEPAPTQVGPISRKLEPLVPQGPGPLRELPRGAYQRPFAASDRPAANEFDELDATGKPGQTEIGTVAAKRIKPAGRPGWSKNPEEGTAFEGPDKTPGDANVKPGEAPAEMSPKMKAYRDKLKDAEDEKFASGMGMKVDDYRAMLARRRERQALAGLADLVRKGVKPTAEQIDEAFASGLKPETVEALIKGPKK